jgi:hypothetical protein
MNSFLVEIDMYETITLSFCNSLFSSTGSFFMSFIREIIKSVSAPS